MLVVKTPHCDDGITVGLMVEAAKDLLSESVMESDLVYFGGIVNDDGKVVAQGMEKYREDARWRVVTGAAMASLNL